MYAVINNKAPATQNSSGTLYTPNYTKRNPIMSTQELLTLLFDAIAISFIAITIFDFSERVTALYKQISNPTPVKLDDSTPQLPQISDPWLLPIEERTEVLSSIKLVQKEQRFLRLLPSAKETNVSRSEPMLENLLLGINLDKLKLREARKIAKVLGIAQKVNGKDHKLDFLCSQIKLKLQQLLQPEVMAAVKTELVAC